MTIRRTSEGEAIGRKAQPMASSREVTFRPKSWDAEARTIDVVLSDERSNEITRRDWWSGDTIRERLSLDPAHVDLGRANNGAPILLGHRGSDPAAQLGKMVEGSARIEGEVGSRQLLVTAHFSPFLEQRDPALEAYVQEIATGIRRHSSVGWREHETIVSRNENGPDLHFVVGWEVMEGSIVAMGADDGAVTRSEDSERERNSAAAQSERNDMTTKTDPSRAAGSEPAEPTVDEAALNERALKLAEQMITERAERAEKLRTLGRVLDFDQDAVDAWIAERGDDGQLRSYDAINARAFDLAAQRADKPGGKAPIRGSVAISAGERDEQDTRAFRMLGQILCHRAGFDQETVKRALKGVTNGGKRYAGVAFKTDKAIDSFDFAREGAFYMRRSMTDMAEISLRADGVDTDRMSSSELVEAALGISGYGMHGRGYNTTGAFPLLLAEVFNVSLRIGYDEDPIDLRWTRRRNARDFRTLYSLTMGEAEDFEEVDPEKPVYPTSTMGESREGFALVEHGRMFKIGRKLLINDYLDGITQIPRKFGAAGNRKMREKLFGLLHANAALSDGVALFSDGSAATRSRNDDGTPSAIGISTIDLMRVRMSQRAGITLDKDGTPVATVRVPLRYLLIGEGKAVHTDQQLGRILTPTQVAPGNAAGVPASFAGLTPIADSSIDAFDAGSGAGLHWYGTDGETVEHAFLEGEEGVQTAVESDFDSRGIKIRASLDFGCGVKDWRGLDRNLGA
jgi:hypothetical protein